MVVGSYVVNIHASRQDVGPIWKPHFMVAAGLTIAVIAVVSTVTMKLTRSGMFNDWLVVKEWLEHKGSVCKFVLKDRYWADLQNRSV